RWARVSSDRNRLQVVFGGQAVECQRQRAARPAKDYQSQTNGSETGRRYSRALSCLGGDGRRHARECRTDYSERIGGGQAGGLSRRAGVWQPASVTGELASDEGTVDVTSPRLSARKRRNAPPARAARSMRSLYRLSPF